MIGDIRRWGSHWPVLIAAVRHTSGPIIEFGSGWSSTPLLATIRARRLLVTVETDLAWCQKFAEILRSGHEIEVVSSWSVDHWFYTRDWGLALVDSLPDPERCLIVDRLVGRAKVVIVHDVQQHDLCRWWANQDGWRHRAEHGFDPKTGVLCDDRDQLDRIMSLANALCDES